MINLKNNLVTGIGAQYLADSIRQVKGINTLSITNEAINGIAREEIISKLENYVSSLDI